MEAYALKGIVIALLAVGIVGFILAILFPLFPIIGSITASLTAILAGIGFLLLLRCRRHEC